MTTAPRPAATGSRLTRRSWTRTRTRTTAARPAGAITYKGRALTGIAAGPYGAPVVIVGEHAPGTPAAEQQGATVRGSYGQRVAELLDLVRASLDALDDAPLDATRAQRQPWWYDPATIETCPRSERLAGNSRSRHLNLHAKRRGEDCTDPACVTHRRKEARRKARSYGITASSVSGLLGAAGFAVRTDRNRGGFSTSGDSAARCVWLHPGHYDAARLTAVLTPRGLVVTDGPTAGVLRVLTRAEAEHQGLDLPAPAAVAAPALPSTATIRAALRRAGLPLASTRDGAPDAGSGLDVRRGEPGEWVVAWSAGHDRDGGDAYRARYARRAEMIAAAAEALAGAYESTVEQRKDWTPKITITGLRSVA
ncbi:hypothetical protein ACFWNL_18480 [Kitasatospora sp. NPDC058397]|uniref:hypothetical protein n=1 Tax=unclassified Kitasatospora TaxID=2633591 RepID=UPI0036539E0D